MDVLDQLRRQFTYDAWANREVIAAIRTGGSSPRPLQLMAHIFAASRVWIERLLQKPQSTPVWPEQPTIEFCEAQAADLTALWNQYLASASASSLVQTFSYKNTKGELWSNTVHDVLTHVILHGAYHRGQIATWMRANGQTPAYTDYIHAVRQHRIQ